MSTSLSDSKHEGAKKHVEAHVADIIHHGEKLILPDGMSVAAAIDLLKRREKYLGEVVVFSETFDVFPWDGAHAFDLVLTARFGWSPAEATPGFFGDNPPRMITIATGPGTTKQVPWGRFSLPNVEGFIDCGVGQKNGRYLFALNAKVTRKDENVIKGLFKELRETLLEHSIYRGKAIKMRFRDEDGDKLEMPEPQFMDTSKISRSQLIYSTDVQAQIETNLFTPIERVEDCLANGMAVKRGVLLGGVYGTGKTMAATVASKLAVDNGITYLYVPRADELSDAIEFGKQYQSPACVIFCEDIDRAVAGERTIAMDDILNIIDGIDTKHANIIVVMTTNDLDAINPAMLRPGRLDAVIEVLPPDAAAVERLLRLYGGESIEAETNLTEAAALLSGNIPAVVAEVVKRAKLSQLRFQAKGEPVRHISEAALVEAASSMQSQILILKKASERKPAAVTMDDLMRGMIAGGVSASLTDTTQKVDALHERVCE